MSSVLSTSRDLKWLVVNACMFQQNIPLRPGVEGSTTANVKEKKKSYTKPLFCFSRGSCENSGKCHSSQLQSGLRTRKFEK